MSTTASCQSCSGQVLFGRTLAGKLMPLEYDGRVIPETTVRNVAYWRHPSGRVDCYVLPQAVAAEVHELRIAADAGDAVHRNRAMTAIVLERALPGVPNAAMLTLTVAHFATCPAAVEHRRARRGEVAGVVRFRGDRRGAAAAPENEGGADVVPLRPRRRP